MILSGGRNIIPGSQESYYDHTRVEEMREKFSSLGFKPLDDPENGLLREVAEIHEVSYSLVLNEAEREYGENSSASEIRSTLKEMIGDKGKRNRRQLTPVT